MRMQGNIPGTGLIHRTRPLLLAVVLLGLAAAGHGQPVSAPAAPGLRYVAERLPEGPWEVRELFIDRGAEYLSLGMALGMGQLRGVEPLSGIVARETAADDYVVAAVNDDFFTMAPSPNAGMVGGMCVRRGELVALPRGRPAFVLMADGTPHIGIFDTVATIALPNGEHPVGGLNQLPVKDALSAYTAVFGWPVTDGCVVLKMSGLPLTVNGSWQGTVQEIVPAGTAREAAPDEVLLHADGAAATALAGLKPGDAVRIDMRTEDLDGPVAMAAGGNLVLLRDGQIPFPVNPQDPRHPRTAIGFNDRQIVIATVDGRQTGWSVGMTYHELAELMQRLGCTDALNIDGGGSTTAWVRGQVVNRPSDGAERRIANAILVRSHAPHGPLTRLTVVPSRLVAMPDARARLTLTGTDDWYNPMPVKPADLAVEAVRPDQRRLSVRLTGDSLRLSGPPGDGAIRFRLKGTDAVLAELPVRMVASCQRLAITPDPIELCVGETTPLSAHGVTDDGQSVALPEEAVRWTSQGAGLAVSQGSLRARRAGVTGTVQAALGATTGLATVRVADEAVLESFEAGFHPAFSKTPDTQAVSGKVGVHSGGAAQGRRYCRLEYDLGEAKGTRASYIRLDRPLGAALRLSLQARATADAAPWLRVAVVDGNGTRQTLTLAEAVTWRQWRRVQVRLPNGLKPPLTWQAIYVVATEGKTGRGSLDIDDLRVEQINHQP